MIFRLLLRGGALGAKFLLVLAITHYLGYEALGFYGVVVAASLIASKFYSVGFSSEINRLISVGGSSRRVVDKVLLLYLAVGLLLSVLTVLVYSLFQSVEATATLILCVTLVLLTEHLSFEINSFVFSAQKATAGALLFFIKTGLWAVLAVGGMVLGWVAGIASVLWLWVAANVLVIIAGYLIVVNVHKGREAATLDTATVWKAGLPFYLGTGLIALSQYAERFLIIDLEPYASLGKYVYAWSAANTLQALSYAVVAVVGIPVLAKRFQADQQAFTVRQLFVNKWVMRSLAVSAVVAVAIYVFFNVLLDYVAASVPRPDNAILAVLIFFLRVAGDWRHRLGRFDCFEKQPGVAGQRGALPADFGAGQLCADQALLDLRRGVGQCFRHRRATWCDCSVDPCHRRKEGCAVMGLKLPRIEFRGRTFDSSISFLILFTGLFLSVAMPLLVPRDPGPDAMTLWSSYARADNCNFWNPFSPDRSSYECSAFLLRPTGINLTNAWAYGMFCNFFLTAIPVVVFRRMPLTIFGTLCLWGIVRSFFLENLTKEIIVSVAVLSILLSALTRKYRGGFFLSAVIYGVLIRPYWILFSLSWVGVCVMKKYVSRFTFFLMLFLFYLAVAMAIQLALGFPVSSIRASNNELRTAGEEGSKSLIVSWLSGSDFVSRHWIR